MNVSSNVPTDEKNKRKKRLRCFTTDLDPNFSNTSILIDSRNTIFVKIYYFRK